MSAKRVNASKPEQIGGGDAWSQQLSATAEPALNRCKYMIRQLEDIEGTENSTGAVSTCYTLRDGEIKTCQRIVDRPPGQCWQHLDVFSVLPHMRWKLYNKQY